MKISEIRLFHPETIEIEPSDRNRAKQLSDRVVGEDHQWLTYLNGLAFMGLTRWLKRYEQMDIDSTRCSLLNPIYSNVLDVVCNIQVNGFELCLIATEHVLNETLILPRAVIDLPSFSAHVYVLMEVWEEQGKMLLRGVVRHDQLLHYLLNIQPAADWTYSFPLSVLNLEPHFLIHYLQKLNPAAISLSSAQTIPIKTVETIDVQSMVEKLGTSYQPIWHDVSWEEGAMLLGQPELLRLLYQMRTVSEPSPALRIRLGEVAALLTQTAVDTTCWMQNQLDELAQRLDLWTVASLTPAMAFRKSGRFEHVIVALRNNGLDIPGQTQAVYQDVDLNGLALRLCNAAIQTPKRQWSLLTILGTQTGENLPEGTQLRVSNTSRVLHDPVLEFDQPFLYTLADAVFWEKLVVSIVIGNTVQTLTPYTYGQSLGQITVGE